MHKTAITAGTAAAVIITTLFCYRSGCRDFYERFPEFDHKIIRQAYRRMLRKLVTYKYEDLALITTDADIDRLFENEVLALNNL